MKRILALLAAAAISAACSDTGTEPQSTGIDLQSRENGELQITVMSWNVYVGGDVDAVITSAPDRVPFVAADVFQQIMSTDFTTRAVGIVDQIEEFRPHVVGLQEITLLRRQSPGDFLQGNPQPAEEVVVDFLAILQSELASRGLDYRVGAIVQDTDVELPMATNFPLDDGRLTDYDVILVRGDVTVTTSLARNFLASFEVPGLGFSILRGWTLVDVLVGNRAYRVINTHLDPDVPQIQALQAREVLDLAASTDLPVFVIGDLNSRADGGSTPTYRTMLDAGFEDVWTLANRHEPGFTCCNPDDLRNEVPDLTKRIDFVLLRRATWPGGTEIELDDDEEDGDENEMRDEDHPGRRIRGAFRAEVIGDEPEDRVGGLWPSDHAGVAARVMLARRDRDDD